MDVPAQPGGGGTQAGGSSRMSPVNPASSAGAMPSVGARPDLARLLDAVIRYNASDLHLTVDRQPMVRINGVLRPLGNVILTPDDTTALMKSISSERHQRRLGEHGGADFGFTYNEQARFRVSIFRQKGTIGLVLRLIPSRLLSFEEIGLPPVIKDLCLRPRGLVLVTGPTGSGKTTTLATMLDFINHERTDHIITIEDPIEYYHKHNKCVVTQREIGNDVPDFPEALKRALRMDPDVILVGEMRDLETIQTAITAAETGHLVFATLHTTGAAETIDRVVDVFPTNQQAQIRTQLATTLMAVISQTLVPTKDGKTRVAAFELMFCNDPIRALIRKNETFKVRSFIQTGGKDGMVLLDDFLFNQWTAGKIDYQPMMERAQDLEVMEQKVREYTEVLKRQQQQRGRG
jgi:twitching motility protein PilT